MSNRVDSVRRLMQSHRSRWQRLRLLEAVGWALSGICGYFLAALLLDNVAHLPMLGRLLAAAGLLAVAVLLGGQLVRRWRGRHATEDEIALAIEQRTAGGVQNRLINTLQIGRLEDGPATAMSEALVQENCRDLEHRALAGAINSRPAAMWLLLAAALVAVGVVGWVRQPSQFSTSAKRILLPFAAIDPIYRTRLIVEPGDIEAAGDVTITVRISGERPAELAVLLAEAQRSRTHTVPVPPQGVVTYTVKNIESSLSYAVRGGDFTSPYYRIETPTPARLSLVRTTYHYPPYTGLPDKTTEHGGDLEGVAGTQAEMVFVLDRPADKAALIVRGVNGAPHKLGETAAGSASATPSAARSESTTALKSCGAKEFSGQLLLDDASEYAIETQRGGRSPHRSPWHTVRVMADEPPRLELTGLPTSGEISIDSALPLTVSASDDFGLARVGLFARRATNQTLAGAQPEAGTPLAAQAGDGVTSSPDAEGWVLVGDWPSKGVTKTEHACELLPEAVGAVEGERLEIVPRAIDNHPDRAHRWTSGTAHVVMVVGDGAQLQILYEQILRSESELATVAATVQSLHSETDGWVRKLDAEPNAGGAPKLPDIVAAAGKLSVNHDQLRKSAGRTAREMVAQAGSMRLSLGMLSDTEMVRTVRVLDSVATRDDAAGCRLALAEARATQHRTLQSLEQIQDQYQRFRQEWELAHMTQFVKMLADRQGALADASRRQAAAKSESSETQRTTASRRQGKLAPLCELAATAFSGLAERVAESESTLSEVFAETAMSLGAEALEQAMKTAQEHLLAGSWADAAAAQQEAAERLNAIYTHLHDAQVEAARRLLAAAEERAESDLAAQAELEKLKAGSSEDLLDEPDGLKLEDIIHMAEVAQANSQKTGKEEKYVNDYLLPDGALGILQQPDSGKRQEFDILKLASAPGSTPSFPKQSDRQGNRVKPHIQEKFEDLVGDLLEEEDEMQANYESFNLNAAFNINEPGEIGKQGGDLNSTAAAAATGNQKPPTTNVGGASRVGRQGARAHGAAVGDESINRRGRDKVQEGQQRSPDQAGSVKETMTDDPQLDTSTGIGGRKVESEDTHFSLNDAGEWTDDMAQRMDKPQEKQSIVERQGGKLDAEVADMMRDRTSKQEQIIERLKTIRKELKNLYLPTDRLDELIEQMQAQTSSLKERPTAEVYRLQQQTLAQVRGALQVFHQAHSGFQASLPRDQAVRGRVLDDPARITPPGYEQAVKNYYNRLSMP